MSSLINLKDPSNRQIRDANQQMALKILSTVADAASGVSDSKSIQAIVKRNMSNFKEKLERLEPKFDLTIPDSGHFEASLHSDSPLNPQASTAQSTMEAGQEPLGYSLNSSRRGQDELACPSGGVRYTLQSIRHEREKGRRSGIPGHGDARTDDQIMLRALNVWSAATDALLGNIQSEACELISNAIHANVDTSQHALFADEVFASLASFVKERTTAAGDEIHALLAKEKDDAVTYNDRLEDLVKKRLEVIRKSVEEQLLLQRGNIRSGIQRAPSRKKDETFSNVPDLNRIAEWSKEVQFAARISAYYLITSEYYVESVGRSIRREICKPMQSHKDLMSSCNDVLFSLCESA